MIRRQRRTDMRLWLLVMAAGWGLAVPSARGAATAERALYWWQDEIRTAAFALSEARTGKVAQWPRLAVPAGSATLPLPRVSGEIRADGRLDEEAWKTATQFPAGPVFDDWQRGPFLLRVSVGRDDQTLYVAIESPRDLTGLGALSPDGELFSIGKQPFRVGPGGNVPAASVGRTGAGCVVELALPLTTGLNLSFAVEVLRRTGDALPAELTSLGLDELTDPPGQRPRFRAPCLWLEPVTVRLVPADVAVQLACETVAGKPARLTASLRAANGPPVTGEVPLTARDDAGVYRYEWKPDTPGPKWTAEGFFYREPMAEILAGVRRIVGRGVSAEAGKTIVAAADGIAAEAAAAAPAQAAAWRDLYCRARGLRAEAHLQLLDAPLLFVKQHPYFAGHIYDDFYTWHPGGGLYVLENPQAPAAQRRFRPLIDATTNETLGAGVYRDPDLSWDARQVVFACKPAADAVTSLYTIGRDGRGLQRLTASDTFHDITPAWLPDDRIVFISTRPRALVPCFNSGVGTLHTMHADGSDLRSISANNVTEFDPAVLPDGRILYGRWEYVDKTALYMQSLWTMAPDGRMEEALFANNLAKPTAVLDARPVPNQQLVVVSLTPHNGQSVGAIGMIDLRGGKNDLATVTNFTPEYPVEMDQGLAAGPCDPYPLSADDVLISNNALGAHGVLEVVGRDGSRELVLCDPEISCYSPLLIKPRPRPDVVTPHTVANEPGRFLVADVHQGLTGVTPGTIKWLRVVEETARTSGIPPGGRWWNQAFLISWQGGYVVKNILGVVPVEADGSAYFEAPPGRALYFEALDADGREIQRMRTFVQAAPGVTRSCIGCHEAKKHAPLRPDHLPLALQRPASRLQPESWGSGYIDYASMVQPVLDKYCVRCHGGPEGMGKGLDFSGGWTWAFNISYETLIKHRLTGFLNCNNGSVHTSQILPPRTIGSGAAPLAEILIKRHPEISRAERDLVLAWMDTNSNYYGTWDYTPHATCDAIRSLGGPLAAVMDQASCTACHPPGFIGNDWVNLQTPEWSRILRAPMAQRPSKKGSGLLNSDREKGGLGLGMCRQRKARPGYPLVDQSVQPPDVMLPSREPSWDPSGAPHVTIASSDDPHYQAMLAIIRRARAEALARPRIDMPGAVVEAGQCRMQVPVPVPDAPPALAARVRSDAAVELSWPRTADTIGLQYEVHRGAAAQFPPEAATQIGLTTAGRFVDLLPPVGTQHYALVVTSGAKRSQAVWTTVSVPSPPSPAPPRDVTAQPLPGEVALAWQGLELPGVRYHVYRGLTGAAEGAPLTPEPVERATYSDFQAEPGTSYVYTVRAIDRRGQLSPPSLPVEAAPLPEIKEPALVFQFGPRLEAARRDGSRVPGRLHGDAKLADGVLELGAGGFATFDALPECELRKAFTLACWVRIDAESPMPVVVAAGAFNDRGWFLQRYGNGWRWHLAPTSCDGGRPVVGRWTHLVGTFDGRHARLYQDGQPVAQAECYPTRVPWTGPLVLGQYSGQGPSYQVHGGLKAVTLYDRALRPAEVAAHFAAGAP